MKTRMEKYYDEENNNIALRQRKNEKLYENVFKNYHYNKNICNKKDACKY